VRVRSLDRVNSAASCLRTERPGDRTRAKRRDAFAGHSMVIGEILSVSGAKGRIGAVTDVFPDPTEPAPTDLLEFPPFPRRSGGAGTPGGAAGTGGGSGERAGRGSAPIRVVPDAEATARLRIMLPTQAPTPSTALRPQASWEDSRAEEAPIEAFARVAASPASPSTLPSQLAAMTTATMVIPLPPSLRPGSGLLTTTLPPDQAALANAARIGDAFRDTIEEIFGVDLDTADPAEVGLAPFEQRAAGRAGGAAARGTRRRRGTGGTAGNEPGYGADEAADYEADEAYPGEFEPGYGAGTTPAAPAYAPMPLPRPVPAEVFGGAYGVPTQHAPLPELANPFGQSLRGVADPSRHALALRYLGGIFHDSSGESSYLDPEELDQGWIPSAFGAAAPDAPTEQLARVPALGPPSGAAPSAAPAGAARRAGAVPPSPPPSPPPPPPPATAADVTAVLPVQTAPEPAHGSRSGSRASHAPHRGRRPEPQPPAAGRSGSGSGGSGRSEPPSRTGTAGTAKTTGTAATERAGRNDRTGRNAATGRNAGTGRARQRAAASAASSAERDGGGRKRGRTLTVLALCCAAFALLYGIALLVAGGVLSGTVPAGVSVDGVPLGGLSPDAARSTLVARLGPAADKPIALQVGQTPVTLAAARGGLSLDVSGTVAAAQGQRTNPFTVIPALFGVGHAIDPVVSVDRSALTNSLNALASAYDSALVEGKITFAHAQPVVTAPREGRGFDVAAAVNAVASGYLRTSAPIVLPVNALTPLATPLALQNALEQLARPAVSAPITLVTDGVETVLTPDQIGAALTIVPNRDGVMVPELDGALLRADLNPAARATEQPGADAAFTVADGRPQLVPEKDGVGYSAQALTNAVAGALTRTGSGRTVTVPRGPLPPAFTTADAQALGVQAVLGEAALTVPDGPDRTVDVRRATSLVAGAVVQPGAMWSFDKTVGAPTAANGFSASADSGQDGVDASGGADLVATAVFDATFRAGMGDTVHHPNAAYSSRYPVGLDAAVVWPGTDLQWTNSSSHPVYLYAAYAGGTLTVDLLGQTGYDAVDVTVSDRQHVVGPTGSAAHGCPAQSASNGFQVDVTRVLTRAGAQVGTEQFHVTYVPSAGTTCGSDGTQSPPAGSGTSSGRPSSGSSAGGTPTGGGAAGSGGGAGNPPPTAPSQPAPDPTNSGVLGGLLH